MKGKQLYTKLTFLLFLSIQFFMNAQPNKTKPQKIGGIAKENKPIEFYEEQSILWKQVIDKTPENAEAWHYHYKAERAKLQLEQSELWANDKEACYAQLASIISDSKPYIGDQFEYYYIKGMNSNREQSIGAFKKAYEIDPGRKEVHSWLFTHYVPQFNDEECTDLAKKMLANNIYSDANLKWNYNALLSVEENGVFISNGDMDGIPKWVLQYGPGIRKDVLVTNKSLLAYEETYREMVYDKLNLSQPTKEKTDFDHMGEYVDYLAVDLLKRSKRPTYISAGTPLNFFKTHQLEENMYLVGNVLKYATTNFDNILIVKDNIENKYYLEYLFQNFQQHHEDQMVKSRMNLTYLPAFIVLKKHYQTSGNQKKLDYMNNLIDKVATDSGNKQEVLNWFDK